MTKTIIIALIALVFLPHTARAQIVERICNGHIPCSYKQFKEGEMTWYNRADTNHDGIIDAKEQAAIWQTYAQDILPNCRNMEDLNLLKITHAPTEQQMRQNFAFADLNGDGVIDADEDQQVTEKLNQMCLLLRNPNVKKIQQLFKKLNTPQ